MKFSKPMIASIAIATLMASHTAAQPAQNTFDNPQSAAEALVKAAESFDVPSLLQILGPGSRDLVVSEDPVVDKTRATEFARLAREKQQLNPDPKNPNRVEMVVGNSDWPLPIPMVKRNGKWSYDSSSGRREILLRRIGENEFDAIRICRGFVEAEHEYALEKHDASRVKRVCPADHKYAGEA